MARRSPEQKLRDGLREQLTSEVRRLHPHDPIEIAWMADGRPAAFVVGKPASYTLSRDRLLR